MRAIWNGSIGFGLVNIPIKLYSGVQNSNLDLDMLDERDHANIKYQRINENTRKEVPYDKIVKGYFLKDRYIILDDHDFEEAAPEKSKTIELENFVDIHEINPIYYETSYYASPEKQGVKAYAPLLKALIKSKKAAIGRFVLRTTERLCVIHPLDDVIVISKIRFQEEIRKRDDLKKADDVKVSKKELDMGLALIKQYSSDFDITGFKMNTAKNFSVLSKQKQKANKPLLKNSNPRRQRAMTSTIN